LFSPFLIFPFLPLVDFVSGFYPYEKFFFLFSAICIFDFFVFLRNLSIFARLCTDYIFFEERLMLFVGMWGCVA